MNYIRLRVNEILAQCVRISFLTWKKKEVYYSGMLWVQFKYSPEAARCIDVDGLKFKAFTRQLSTLSPLQEWD